MAESLAVKNLKEGRKNKEIKEAILSMPLTEKMERLKELFGATCMDLEPSVGPEEMRVFEKCRGDLPAEKAKEILEILLRLKKPGATEDLGPAANMLDPDGKIPAAAAGEERIALGRDLTRALAMEIEPLENRLLDPDEDPSDAQAQFDRDEILARGQEKVALMNRAEESSLRQVWRLTHLLINIKKAASAQKNIENEESSQYVAEKKRV